MFTFDACEVPRLDSRRTMPISLLLTALILGLVKLYFVSSCPFRSEKMSVDSTHVEIGTTVARFERWSD